MELLSNEIKATGRWGEEQAARYLKRKGYRVLCRNYTCRFGEIDIIASYRNYLVFVEVKTRKDASFAQAREFVGYGNVTNCSEEIFWCLFGERFAVVGEYSGPFVTDLTAEATSVGVSAVYLLDDDARGDITDIFMDGFHALFPF